MLAALAPDAELISPLAANGVFRGTDDLRVLLSSIYSILTELEWQEPIGDGATRLVLGTAKVGRFRLSDAMVLEIADDGRISRIRPHLRPWLATTVFAMRVGPRLGRHPGVLRRAGILGGRGSRRFR